MRPRCFFHSGHLSDAEKKTKEEKDEDDSSMKKVARGKPATRAALGLDITALSNFFHIIYLSVGSSDT